MTNAAVDRDAIRFNGVSVRIRGVAALDNVTLNVHTGSVCGLCGPNGAGKSTAIRVVCGLQRPSSGYGIVLGEPLDEERPRRRARIGYMAQRTVLYDELTVAENFRFRAAVMGIRHHRRRARECLGENGLDHLARTRVGALSGGWRQRVAFATALLSRPPLLLLDEPTAGLDAVSRMTLWREVRRISTAGVTVLVSTHDPVEAALCDQLIMLERGRIAFDGEPQRRWSAQEMNALRSAAAIGMGTSN